MNSKELNTSTTTTTIQKQDNNNNEVSIFENEVATLKQNVIEYLKTTTQKLTKEQAQQFWSLCKIHNLNPLKREIYGYTFGGQLTTVVGYQVYVKRAEQTGMLEYHKIEIERNEEGLPVKGWFIGKRKDRSQEFKMEFYFNEWKPKFGGIWNDKPTFMFQKVIYANGMRWLFPNELGELPYLQEELWYHNQQHQKDMIQNVKEEEEENENSSTSDEVIQTICD